MSTSSIETQQSDNRTNSKVEERRRSVNRKGFLQERGFDNEEEIPIYIREEINRRGWTKFCRPQPCFVPDLVSEFYTNLDLVNPWNVTIRGKEIAVNYHRINALYEAPSPNNEFDEVIWRLDGMLLPLIMQDISLSKTDLEVSLPTIIQQICNSDTDVEDAEKNGILKETLKPEARIWNHFIKTRLLPCTQDRIISRETAVMLHCIIMHRRINVGLVIHQQMQECVKRKSGHMWFPNIITQLCHSQGVERNDDDYRIGPARTISAGAIRRLIRGNIVTDDETEEGSGSHPKRRRVRQQALRPEWAPRPQQPQQHEDSMPQQQQQQQTVEVQPGSPSTEEPEILRHPQVFPRRIKTKCGRRAM